MRHGGGRSGLLLRDLAYACCLWTGVYVSALYLLEHAFWVRRSDLAYDTLWNFHYLVSVPSTAIAALGAVLSALQLIQRERDWRFAPLSAILAFVVNTQDRTLLKIGDYVVNLLQTFDLYERTALPFCALVLLVSSLRWFAFRRSRFVARLAKLSPAAPPQPTAPVGTARNA